MRLTNFSEEMAEMTCYHSIGFRRTPGETKKTYDHQWCLFSFLASGSESVSFLVKKDSEHVLDRPSGTTPPLSMGLGEVLHGTMGESRIFFFL